MASINGAATIAIPVFLLAIELLLVGLRLFANLRCGRGRLVVGDYLLICSMLIETLAVCTVSLAVSLELKYEKRADEAGLPPQAFLTREEVALTTKLSIEHGIVYYTVVWLVKATILSLYLEIFSKLPKRLKVLVIVSTAIAVVTYLVTMFAMFFQCGTRPHFWTYDFLDPEYCPITQTRGTIVYFVCTIIADLAILITSFLVIRTLTLTARTRTGCLLVILCGLLSITASIIVFNLVLELTRQSTTSADRTRLAIVFTSTEYFFGVAACCGPSFRLLFRRGAGEGGSSSNNRRASVVASLRGSKSWLADAIQMVGGRAVRRGGAEVEVAMWSYRSAPSGSVLDNMGDGREDGLERSEAARRPP